VYKRVLSQGIVYISHVVPETGSRGRTYCHDLLFAPCDRSYNLICGSSHLLPWMW